MTQDVHCPDSCEISGSEVLPFLLDMNLTQQELEVESWCSFIVSRKAKPVSTTIKSLR